MFIKGYQIELQLCCYWHKDSHDSAKATKQDGDTHTGNAKTLRKPLPERKAAVHDAKIHDVSNHTHQKIWLYAYVHFPRCETTRHEENINSSHQNFHYVVPVEPPGTESLSV